MKEKKYNFYGMSTFHWGFFPPHTSGFNSAREGAKTVKKSTCKSYGGWGKQECLTVTVLHTSNLLILEAKHKKTYIRNKITGNIDSNTPRVLTSL